MARENPTWGRRRIQAELALLGYAVAELTVAKYMHRTSPRPSPTWRVFLATHARDIVAVDFVFGFEVLVCDRCGGRRRILGAVTEPHAVRRLLAALGLAAEPPPAPVLPAA
jgi:hypothetical protein